MRKLSLSFFSVFLAMTVNSQVMVNELISFGGDSFQNMDWSAGECMTESFNQGDHILTQGFQQGQKSQETAVPKLKNLSENITVFPNPARDNMMIVMDNEYLTKSLVSFTMVNETGQIKKKGVTLNETTIINIQSLPAGLYILNIFSNKEIIQSFKIIKQ